MIERIISLTNIGRFEKYKHQGSVYDTLPKNVVIYAENGSGKTTLSILFKSLNGDDKLLAKKQTFGTLEAQAASIRIEGSIVKYLEGHWSAHFPHLEIFDVHFIEDNLYTGSISASNNKLNLFDYVVGEKGSKMAIKIAQLQSDRDKFFRQQSALQYPANPHKIRKREWEKINKQIADLKIQIKVIQRELRVLQKELGEYSQQVFNAHAEEINKQLSFFTPYIQLKKFSNRSNKKSQQLSYYLKVNETEVTFDLEKKVSSVKYSLSEGDKSAVALAFFLTKVYMSPDPSKKIIIFDDPISSFDAHRRNATIAQLQKLSSKVKQLIVLTHDIYFARDVSQRIGTDVLNLKVVRKSAASDIVLHDIANETMSGIFKDIGTLNNYYENGSDNDNKKREVIRCIRPILEGIIRIKYFNLLRANEWLGDFISKVRDAAPGEAFSLLKPYIDELIELNDYSKSYHHSNPAFEPNIPINEAELKLYVGKTLKLIRMI